MIVPSWQLSGRWCIILQYGAGWNGCLRCKSVCLEGRSLVHHRFDVYGNCGIEEIDRTIKVNRQAIRNKTQTNTNTNTNKHKHKNNHNHNLVRGPWLSPSHSEGWKLSPSYDGRVSDLFVVSQRRKCERVVDLWWTSCESSGSWTNENWCRKVLALVCCNDGMDVVEGVCIVVSGVGFTLISWSCRDGGQKTQVDPVDICLVDGVIILQWVSEVLVILVPIQGEAKGILIDWNGKSLPQHVANVTREMYRILSKISSTRFVPGYIASSEFW